MEKDASREEIIEAAKIAQCDHFIRTLPQGYDTIISSENGALSQGQQQLLTIARIILANPPVVILDSNFECGHTNRSPYSKSDGNCHRKSNKLRYRSSIIHD